eukprot:CAMPEP_0117446598 /NCGR_PEP_ID=MMETSP0759-20121206/6429_1 /TAXON_ID=63605 /ORGANISM="Percolomonas cosmopolitus, Strain WS" /LENGTH=528 /DNA_ID=CAMNT_0005238881 /DNA_START=6 /DNA_END=1593 /DNA_ORIENTATION=+
MSHTPTTPQFPSSRHHLFSDSPQALSPSDHPNFLNASQVTNFSPPIQQSQRPKRPFKMFHAAKALPRSPLETLHVEHELQMEFSLVTFKMDGEAFDTAPPTTVDIGSFIVGEMGWISQSDIYKKVTGSNAELSPQEALDKKNNLRKARAAHDFILSQWDHSLYCYQYFAKVMAHDKDWMRRFGASALAKVFGTFLRRILLQNGARVLLDQLNGSAHAGDESDEEVPWYDNEETRLKVRNCLNGVYYTSTEHQLNSKIIPMLDSFLLVSLFESVRFTSKDTKAAMRIKLHIMQMCLKVLSCYSSLMKALETQHSRFVQLLFRKLFKESKQSGVLERDILTLLQAMAEVKCLDVTSRDTPCQLELLALHNWNRLQQFMDSESTHDEAKSYYCGLRSLRESPEVGKLVKSLMQHEWALSHGSMSWRSWNEAKQTLLAHRSTSGDAWQEFNSSVLERNRMAQHKLFVESTNGQQWSVSHLRDQDDDLEDNSDEHVKKIQLFFSPGLTPHPTIGGSVLYWSGTEADDRQRGRH